MTPRHHKKNLLLALVLAIATLGVPSAWAAPALPLGCADIAGPAVDVTGSPEITYVGERVEFTLYLHEAACTEFSYPLYVYSERGSGDALVTAAQPVAVDGTALTYSVDVGGLRESVCIQNRVTNANGTTIYDLAPHEDGEALPDSLSSACMTVLQGGAVEPDLGGARSYS